MSGLLLTAACWFTPTHRVGADDTGLAIDVDDARERCVTERALRTRIAHYRRHPESVHGLEVRVQSAGGGFEFVVMHDGSVLSRRRFDALPTNCDDRRDTLALAIALAIENALERAATGEVDAETDDSPAAVPSSSAVPASAATQQPSERSADVESARAAAPPRKREPPLERPQTTRKPAEKAAPEPASPESPPRKDAAARDTPGVIVRGGARYALQILPVPTFMFAAGIDVPLGESARLSLAGLVSLARHSEFADRRLRTQLYAAEALGCGVFGVEWVGLQACGGVVGGAVTAAGQGYDQDYDAVLAWLAGVVRLSLNLPRSGPVAARLFGDGFVNVVRPIPQVRSGGEKVELVTAVVGVSLGAELTVIWP